MALDYARERLHVASPPARPLLIFDGDCNFCRRWIGRWRQMTGERVDYASSQEVGAQYPEISAEDFKQAVQLVEPDGTVFSGAHAVLRTLAHAPWRGGPLWLYEKVPGLASTTETVYGLVARHRGGFSSATNLLWGRHLDPPRYRMSHWMFLRGVGLTYLIAFLSLWVQIDGLVGSRGISPMQAWLTAVREHTGTERYRILPTVCWLWNSDAALHGMCVAGAISSIALMIGAAPWLSALVCWILYLSFFHTCDVFLHFQWDLLLLEAGFLAILLAPMPLWSRPSSDRPAPRIVQFLLVFLIFKLMFSSGIVKFTWEHEPIWHSFTALNYHYETQPLAPWTAWYAHHWPAWFQKLSCGFVYFVELCLPFLVWGPRGLKRIAAAGFVLLMALISATGNYCFFNLLTVFLCLPLLDDFTWPARWRRWFLGEADTGVAQAGSTTAPESERGPCGDSVAGVSALSWFGQDKPRAETCALPATSDEFPALGSQEVLRPSKWRGRVAAPFALVIVTLGFFEMLHAARGPAWEWPESIAAVRSYLSPFAISNGYGLFRSMTTERIELVIEGSDDARQWREYEFKYKPGDVNRRPAFVQPHQPRLDWQMWFVPLGPMRQSPWFIRFLERLLEGSPAVEGLLANNPFPERPPRFLRVVEYEYHFTDANTRRQTGAWWTRELKGYSFRQPISLEMFDRR